MDFIDIEPLCTTKTIFFEAHALQDVEVFCQGERIQENASRPSKLCFPSPASSFITQDSIQLNLCP